MLDALVRAGASAPAIHAAQLAGAVESLQGALAIFDSDDRLVLCNGRFRGLLGEIPATRLAGRAYADILDDWLEALVFASPGEREVYRRDRLAERGAPDGTSDARTLDGRSLRMTTRRTADGGMVLTVWDLSEDVRREEELRTARAAADTANTAKSEFLASMSHELRTPLSAVLGFAQLLQRDVREPLSPRHRARVDQIMRGGEHLLRLINDILDLSGIEAGRTSISVEPVHLAEVLEELRVTLLPMATHHGISLAVDILPAEIPAVLVDRTRFAQVLMNFGSNAIKYNRAGGAVVLSVERRPDGRVRVSVIDSGIGIPLGEQDKLFQPFHRAGQETGSIEGTGIGLAISRRLAALMHACVGFTSKPDIGSTFWIDVVAEGERGAVAEVPSIGALVTLHVVAPQIVLHVEDNPANIAFMTDLLGGFPSIELVTATTAELGIGLAVTRRPATILMDINLPGMSGLEALHALRSSPVTAGIPVIALTAAASDRDRERGLAAGFFRYLTKPVRVDELLLALDAVLAPGLAEAAGEPSGTLLGESAPRLPMITSALFPEGPGVHDAVNRLVDAGYTRDRFVVLFPRDQAVPPVAELAGEKIIQHDTALGGAFGGLVGGLLMLGAFALTGPLGPLVVSAAGLGVLGGSMVGLLVGAGLSDDLAARWVEKAHEGFTVLGVRGVEDAAERERIAALLVASGGTASFDLSS